MSIVLNLGFKSKRGFSDNKMQEHLEPDKPKLNKRGLSDVVTAVMLILIGLAVVGILASAVFNVVSAPSFSPAFNCLDWKSNQVLTLDKVCYSEVGEEIIVKVKRTLNDDFEVEGFKFILELDKGGSSSFGCGSEGCLCEVLGVGSSKNYYLDVSGLDSIENVVLGFDGCELDKEEVKVC